MVTLTHRVAGCNSGAAAFQTLGCPSALPPFLLLSCVVSFSWGPTPWSHLGGLGSAEPGRQTVSVHFEVKNIGLWWVAIISNKMTRVHQLCSLEASSKSLYGAGGPLFPLRRSAVPTTFNTSTASPRKICRRLYTKSSILLHFRFTKCKVGGTSFAAMIFERMLIRFSLWSSEKL